MKVPGRLCTQATLGLLLVVDDGDSEGDPPALALDGGGKHHN